MTANSTSSYTRTEAQAREESSLYFILFSGLLAVGLILNKIVHEHPRLSNVLSEASLILLVGLVAGGLVNLYLELAPEHHTERVYNLGHSLLSFNANVFFMALLPPILFQSGFELRRELFYRHIQPITLFACLGTTLAALSTAGFLYGVQQLGLFGGSVHFTLLELLTFASLISATDTVTILAVFSAKKVDPHVFYVVFGESALNDAVALVLYHTFADFMIDDSTDLQPLWQKCGEILLGFVYKGAGSPILGMAFGFGVALIFKYADLRHFHLLELSLYLLCMYIPYLVAESIDLSGIVSVFFTGMAARRYIVPNVSERTNTSSQSIFQLAAFLAETCIFLDLGLSVFGLTGSFHWVFVAWAFLACLFGRAAGIYPLSYIYNVSLREVAMADESQLAMDDSSSVGSVGTTKQRRTPHHRKDKKISFQLAHILWFSGLRGAVGTYELKMMGWSVLHSHSHTPALACFQHTLAYATFQTPTETEIPLSPQP